MLSVPTWTFVFTLDFIGSKISFLIYRKLLFINPPPRANYEWMFSFTLRLVPQNSACQAKFNPQLFWEVNETHSSVQHVVLLANKKTRDASSKKTITCMIYSKQLKCSVPSRRIITRQHLSEWWMNKMNNVNKNKRLIFMTPVGAMNNNTSQLNRIVYFYDAGIVAADTREENRHGCRWVSARRRITREPSLLRIIPIFSIHHTFPIRIIMHVSTSPPRLLVPWRISQNIVNLINGSPLLSHLCFSIFTNQGFIVEVLKIS